MKTQFKFNLLAVMLSATLIVSAINPKAPSNLSCFDKNNPVGVASQPYFGWLINDKDNNEVQTAYQIIVASSIEKINQNTGDVWDSGKLLSDNQNYNYAENIPLIPAAGYYWKVRTWDKDNQVSPYSATAQFTTGLFDNVDWQGAKWIKRDSKDLDDYTYFRKKFDAQKLKIIKATTFVTACHDYILYLNGKQVGKGYVHHYPQYAYYHAYDITPELKSGSVNLLSCLTHWYGGGQGRATGARGLLVKTIIEYSNGSKEFFVSDQSWKQHRATPWLTRQAQRGGEGVGYVERYDSNLEISGWNTFSFDDSKWENANEIGEHPVKPWTGTLRPDLTRLIEHKISPATVTELGKGHYMIDLGKIYTGSFQINFIGGKPGDTIQMTGGYVLKADGTVNTKMNQSTNLDFYFIHNGTSAVFCPHVYYGMRYLEVKNSPCKLTKNNAAFIFRHFELNPAQSSFISSNSTLNNVWDLMKHSLLLGAQENFVDTPTREKGGFLGDGWSQAVPALSTMYDRTMNIRALTEFLDSQDQFWPDGRLNAVYPNSDGGRDIPDYTQSFVVWVWDYYLQTGNKKFLETHYKRLKKIVDYVAAHTNDSSGLIYKLKGGFNSKGGLTQYSYGIIDWPETMRYGYDMKTTSRTVINVYAYACFDIFGKIAGLTAHTNDAAEYQTKALKIKQAINSQMLNENGIYIDGIYDNGKASKHVSQHANIMPLALGIVSPANNPKVVDEVKKRKMNVGMVSLRWLPESLGEANEGEHLVELYSNPDWDGWAKTLRLGGTCTWESWDADQTGQSLSHPWGAVGLLAMQQYMLGIKPLKPQHALIQIKPLYFGTKLTSVSGVYPTDRGQITLSWSFKNNDYKLQVNIPANINAEIYVPKCGKTGNQVKLNGAILSATESGDYLLVANVGSGKYTIER